MDIITRNAGDADAELIIGYLKKLADYEKMGDRCGITPEALTALLHEENGLHAEIAEADGTPVGMMTYYFYKIATFSGKRVLYIEDIFIDEEYRRKGMGSRLFEKAKLIAKERDCAEIQWKCLDWNTDAQEFYKKIGADTAEGGWLTFTLGSDKFQMSDQKG